jgi:L-fucose isomerase-like protein
VTAGRITFDFPPQYGRADVAKKPTAFGGPLARLLGARGIDVVDPIAELAALDPGAAGGVRDGRDLALCLEVFRARRIDCLLIEVFHWARIALVVNLVDQLNVPTAVVAVTGEGWNGIPCAGAICGSIREAPRNRPSALLEAFLDTDVDALLRWISGASAYSTMRRSRVMLWGGSYGAEMPYTRSDPASLEASFLGEVMTEQEEVLVERADEIVARDRRRIDSFLAWLKGHGGEIEYDEVMVMPAALDFQVALYLAARDRLEELALGDSPGSPGIAAASIKCHYEMSLTCQGCTACLLPAFLAFGVDAEGPRRIIPFACEGDLNGAATAALLFALNTAVPPLFGDLVSYRPDHVLVRNCGGSSVYWAGRSADPARSLAGVRLRANLHGKSGAAVHYETPDGGDVTFARLFRQQGSFGMLLGEGRILQEAEGSSYDDPWPHTRLALGVDTALLFRAMPCNHGTLTEGRLASEIETACGYAGVPVFRCDEENGLRRLIGARRTASKESP